MSSPPADITTPHVVCKTCGYWRDCMKHRRADMPPDAATEWLKHEHVVLLATGKCYRFAPEYQAGMRAGRNKP